LSGMLDLGGSLLVLTFMGGYILSGLKDAFVFPFKAPQRGGLLEVLRQSGLKAFLVLVPFLILPVILAIGGSLVQGGLVFRPFKLEPERINPIEGLKRIFSRYALMEFLKGLLKFSAGGVLLYLMVKKVVIEMAGIAFLGLEESLSLGWSVLLKTLRAGVFLFFVIAVVDYLNERWRFERSLRMSPEELKEEFRETEGDPLVKARIRSIQRELARRRMMEEVPKATVVITNPTHLAIALRYEKDRMNAPKVVAKGAGVVAEKIREIARKHHIPIFEDKPLARALYKVPLGSEIPETLYRAVARILAYIYRLKGEVA
ncbi:MAG: EscU/YscU/HrcU family type III secretion system export apparatus switch protein, partial [Nitrospirae bacterium]